MFKSIRTRIIVVFALICIAITFSVAAVCYFQAKDALQAEIHDKGAQLAVVR